MYHVLEYGWCVGIRYVDISVSCVWIITMRLNNCDLYLCILWCNTMLWVFMYRVLECGWCVGIIVVGIYVSYVDIPVVGMYISCVGIRVVDWYMRAWYLCIVC